MFLVTVFFHDELKSYYTRNFEELARFGQLAGVRDGFAINYGASGMGTLLLANRKGVGPAAACAECLYEEFFLTSWANGDPALLEETYRALDALTGILQLPKLYEFQSA